MRRALGFAVFALVGAAAAEEAAPPALAPCGGCHMAYPAAMLPQASWAMLMAALPRHFGARVALDAAQAKAVSAYLSDYAADGAQASPRDRHYLAATPGEPALRITQTLWWKERHVDLDFARPGAARAWDCRACHDDGFD